MADDLIKQYAEESGIDRIAAEESFRLGLLQAHFASEEVDSVPGLISDWVSIIRAMVATIALSQRAVNFLSRLQLNLSLEFLGIYSFPLG